ncbi:hypothetical protein H920_11558 [Fukomys damarensis]|uniref:Uncharacterized protein n=1 Tax=Fukomys damarensis TaxID=885580 RepID=A0A091DW72_FUKDA|nr:hypothetical protein H920_11558 [Fukomys damarensis]
MVSSVIAKGLKSCLHQLTASESFPPLQGPDPSTRARAQLRHKWGYDGAVRATHLNPGDAPGPTPNPCPEAYYTEAEKRNPEPALENSRLPNQDERARPAARPADPFLPGAH